MTVSVESVIIAVFGVLVCFFFLTALLFYLKERYRRRKRYKKSCQDARLVEIKTPSALMATVPTQTETKRLKVSNPVLMESTDDLYSVLSPYHHSRFIDFSGASTPSQPDVRGYESDQQYFDNIEIRIEPPSSPSLSKCSSRSLSSETAESSLYSSDNLSVNSSSSLCRKKSPQLTHAYSVANIASVHKSSNRNLSELTISLSLLYNMEEASLFVSLHSAYGVPLKAHKTDVFASLFLFPGKAEEHMSKPVLCTTEYIRFNEVFRFEGFTDKCLEKCILRVLLLSRNIVKTGGGRVNRIGEVSILCSNLNLRPLIPVKIEMAADRKKLKKHSTPEKLLERHLGELFLDLQLQPDANRLKVFIRRAEHLPMSQGFQLVKSTHYLSIRLMKNRKVVDSRQSNPKTGRKPVWNEAFLFDIKCEHINSYSIEIILFSKGKLRAKDKIIGHVVIGSNHGPKSGREQWQNMQRPRADVAKWHNILPVFKYI